VAVSLTVIDALYAAAAGDQLDGGREVGAIHVPADGSDEEPRRPLAGREEAEAAVVEALAGQGGVDAAAVRSVDHAVVFSGPIVDSLHAPGRPEGDVHDYRLSRKVADLADIDPVAGSIRVADQQVGAGCPGGGLVECAAVAVVVSKQGVAVVQSAGCIETDQIALEGLPGKALGGAWAGVVR